MGSMGYISIESVGRLSGKFTGDWSGKYVQRREGGKWSDKWRTT